MDLKLSKSSKNLNSILGYKLLMNINVGMSVLFCLTLMIFMNCMGIHSFKITFEDGNGSISI